jgi:hypothetical protein
MTGSPGQPFTLACSHTALVCESCHGGSADLEEFSYISSLRNLSLAAHICDSVKASCFRCCLPEPSAQELERPAHWEAWARRANRMQFTFCRRLHGVLMAHLQSSNDNGVSGGESQESSYGSLPTSIINSIQAVTGCDRQGKQRVMLDEPVATTLASEGEKNLG